MRQLGEDGVGPESAPSKIEMLPHHDAMRGEAGFPAFFNGAKNPSFDSLQGPQERLIFLAGLYSVLHDGLGMRTARTYSQSH